MVLMFLLSGCVHAYWAMDRDNADEVALWEIVLFLFGAQDFMDSTALNGMDDGQRGIVITLSILSMFLFLACALNIFIAVLSDLYDQEQERMVCTFMKERAKICLSLFLRPEWDMLKMLDSPSSLLWQRMRRAVPVALLGLYVLLVWLSADMNLTAWVPALWATCCMIFAQVLVESQTTCGWSTKYLWYCNDKNVDESMFMMEDAGSVRSHGRVGKMKRHVLEQCKAISKECKASVAEVREEVLSLRSSMDATVQELREMRKDLSERLGPPQAASEHIRSAVDLGSSSAAEQVGSHAAEQAGGQEPGVKRKVRRKNWPVGSKGEATNVE